MPTSSFLSVLVVKNVAFANKTLSIGGEFQLAYDKPVLTDNDDSITPFRSLVINALTVGNAVNAVNVYNAVNLIAEVSILAAVSVTVASK